MVQRGSVATEDSKFSKNRGRFRDEADEKPTHEKHENLW